jgi:hypothetical protein
MRVQDQEVANRGKTYMALFLRENQLVQTKNKELKRRAHDLKNQDASYRVQGRLQLKDSLCYK